MVTITGALVARAANATRSWPRWRPTPTRSGPTCTTGTAAPGDLRRLGRAVNKMVDQLASSPKR
ncbi:hypothetical protein OHO83_29580 [Streptomyces sp. NBC_00569]|nr:hypothetical protein [Streptomyces sp. NBC_00569]WUB96113.1 hypothetical protein OHO83_29580 [Streptomyces sp. NBC_00569]